MAANNSQSKKSNMVENFLLAAVGSGILVLIFKTIFRSKTESDSAIIMLVKQLQENVNANNAQIKLLEVELHLWRDKYYKELEEKNKLLDEIRKLRAALQKYNEIEASKIIKL